MYPHLPVCTIRLFVGPLGYTQRSGKVIGEGCVGQPGVNVLLVSPVTLDPGRQVIFGSEVVRLGIVAGGMREDEVVSQVGGVAGPRDEVIYLHAALEISVAVEASSGLYVPQDGPVTQSPRPTPPAPSAVGLSRCNGAAGDLPLIDVESSCLHSMLNQRGQPWA